jgi:hypothetical protein
LTVWTLYLKVLCASGASLRYGFGGVVGNVL